MSPISDIINQFFSGAIGFYCLLCFIRVFASLHQFEDMLSRQLTVSLRFLGIGLFVFVISQVISLLPGTYYIYNIIGKFGAVFICVHAQMLLRAIRKANEY